MVATWRTRGNQQIRSALTHPLVGNTLLLAVNNVIAAIGGFLFWLVAQRLFDRSIVGASSAAVSSLIFLASVGELGLGYALVRFLATFSTARRRQVALMFALVVLIGAAGAMILAQAWTILTPSLAPIFDHRTGVAVFVLGTGAFALAALYDDFLVSSAAVSKVPLKGLITSGARLTLIFFLPGPAIVRLLGAFTLGSLLGMLVTMCLARTRPPLAPAPTASPPVPVAFRQVLAYAAWNSLNGVAGVAPGLLLPLIVIRQTSAADTAVFYITWMLLSGLLMVPSALSYSLLAHGAAKRRVSPLFDRRAMVVALAIVVGFLPAGYIALRIVGATYAREGFPALLVLSLGALPYTAGVFASTRMRLAGSQRLLTMLMATANLFILASAVALTPFFGLVGAALAWTGGQLLYAIVAGKKASSVA